MLHLQYHVPRWLFMPLRGTLALCAAVVTQPMAAAVPSDPSVLQVPYVTQSELLCGGAAVAMLERWWGRRGVYAEEFAALVKPVAGGILMTDLVRATQARGWKTTELRASPEAVQQALRDSVPVIALIRVARDRYHYVVIVGWDAAQVTFHDPAVRPFATMATEDFLERWRDADAWTLLIVPAPLPDPIAISPVPRGLVAVDSLPCRPWLDGAVDAAIEGQLDEADRLLTTAGRTCPNEPLVLRERAGIRFRQGQHLTAIALAHAYLREVPTDSLGWQLLASGQFLVGDAHGALRSWNTIGRPIMDLVRIDGSERTRFRMIVDAIAVTPGDMLTPERLTLAERRVADLPGLAMARVSYTPVAGGTVELHAAVVERPLIPSLTQLLVSGVVRASVRREAQLIVTAPLGAGERWTGAWRWTTADLRRSLRVDIPVHLGLPGTMTLETSAMGFRFSDATAAPTHPRVQRRTTAVRMGGWVSGSMEALVGAGHEQWAAEGEFVTFTVGGALHTLDDRVAVRATGEQALSTSGRPGYSRASVRTDWISLQHPVGIAWTARLGGDWTTATAPRGVRPIAGGGMDRAIPLRAHRYITDNALPAARSGRAILHTGVAADRRVGQIGLLDIGVGVFVDGARISAPNGGMSGQEDYLDAGAGLRIGLPTSGSPVLQLDVARGLLADRRWAVSLGLSQPWPRRLGALQ